MISFIRALIFVLLLEYMGIIYESTSFVLLGFCGAAFLVYSFLYLCWMKKTVTGGIYVPIPVVEAKRSFFIKIFVKINTRFPHGKVKAHVEYNEKNERKKSKAIFTIDKKNDQEWFEEGMVMIEETGTYVFSLKEIYLYDLTGLFYMKKKIKEEDYVLVLPTPEAIPVALGEQMRNFFGDADAYDDLRPGYDPSETFDVRLFRDGDRLQNVHWKLSAKEDALIVKENSLPKACPVVLFLQLKPGTIKEQLLTISSVSFSLMDNGCPHFAVWHSVSQKDLIRTRVDDEESYYRFITNFMQDAQTQDNYDLEGEYKNKYRGENFLHSLVVNKQGDLILDGLEVAKFGQEIDLIMK